ncbi:MAG: hypothetical protein N2202_09640 [Proteobacteria bacterium]|nr:hypothetical protein [Pseudomonadota bacterium]
MKSICRKYCNYYKDNKVVDSNCFPILVAKKAPFYYFPLEDFKFSNNYEELKSVFCERCEYKEHDCDFQNSINPGLPCGGYIYFQHILCKGLITIDEIKRICETI